MGISEAIDFAYPLFYLKYNTQVMSTYSIRNFSPLYYYTEAGINRGINKIVLQKALDAVELLIDDCCYNLYRRTNNQFLKGFYTLLNSMRRQNNIVLKLEQVQRILQFKIDCCTL